MLHVPLHMMRRRKGSLPFTLLVFVSVSNRPSLLIVPRPALLHRQELDALTDPCPLPETVKKRGLNERERLLYAPMADVGGLLYDNDAVYIDIPDWKVREEMGSRGGSLFHSPIV